MRGVADPSTRRRGHEGRLRRPFNPRGHEGGLRRPFNPPLSPPFEAPSAGPPFAGPPSAGPPSAGPPSAGPPAQNFTLFLHFPATVSLFLCLSGGLLVEFGCVFEGRNRVCLPTFRVDPGRSRGVSQGIPESSTLLLNPPPHDRVRVNRAFFDLETFHSG